MTWSHIESRNIVLRPGPSRDEADRVRYAPHDEVVAGVESGRVNTYQHAAILHHRLVDLLESEDRR
jgi:hypothetical protein